MFGRATITLGIGPHSSFVLFSCMRGKRIGNAKTIHRRHVYGGVNDVHDGIPLYLYPQCASLRKPSLLFTVGLSVNDRRSFNGPLYASVRRSV